MTQRFGERSINRRNEGEKREKENKEQQTNSLAEA